MSSELSQPTSIRENPSAALIIGNDIQVYTICHDTPTRIKKSSFFLIPNGKNQRKPLFLHKTDIRIKKSPDFLILTGEVLLSMDLKSEPVLPFKQNTINPPLRLGCFKMQKR